MKEAIGGALAIGFGALVLGFWLAPGWTTNLLNRALGLPTTEDRRLSDQMKTIVLSDLARRNANCPAIKSWGDQRMDGADPLVIVTCTSGESYEVRARKQGEWGYRRVQ